MITVSVIVPLFFMSTISNQLHHQGMRNLNNLASRIIVIADIHCAYCEVTYQWIACSKNYSYPRGNLETGTSLGSGQVLLNSLSSHSSRGVESSSFLTTTLLCPFVVYKSPLKWECSMKIKRLTLSECLCGPRISRNLMVFCKLISLQLFRGRGAYKPCWQCSGGKISQDPLLSVAGSFGKLWARSDVTWIGQESVPEWKLYPKWMMKSVGCSEHPLGCRWACFPWPDMLTTFAVEC